jgi:hypothetical protein
MDSKSTIQQGGEPTFTPEIEREFQKLRETIQEEYRAERRQAYVVTASVLAGLLVVIFAAFNGGGPFFG